MAKNVVRCAHAFCPFHFYLFAYLSQPLPYRHYSSFSALSFSAIHSISVILRYDCWRRNRAFRKIIRSFRHIAVNRGNACRRRIQLNTTHRMFRQFFLRRLRDVHFFSRSFNANSSVKLFCFVWCMSWLWNGTFVIASLSLLSHTHTHIHKRE